MNVVCDPKETDNTERVIVGSLVIGIGDNELGLNFGFWRNVGPNRFCFWLLDAFGMWRNNGC